MRIQKGSLLLFRLFGVNVFVNWTWLVVAIFQIWRRKVSAENYPIPLLILEYLCLFLIVLIHEFGHALACKSVGGIAQQIILWPFGGIAFVQPPPRPGALLWSIAAGPLVNVVLLPLTIIPAYLVGSFSPEFFHAFAAGQPIPTLQLFLFDLAVTNFILLAFNILPIYPLDGGQILQALAWFVFGRAVSLIIAASVGLAGAAALALFALSIQSYWLAFIIAFMAMQSFRGIKIGRAMLRLESAPRYPHTRCPSCGHNPPAGPYWRCTCGATFDIFASRAQCPSCARIFDTIACPDCGRSSLTQLWLISPLVPPPPPPYSQPSPSSQS